MTLEQAEDFFEIMFGQWPAGSVFRYFARRPSDERVHGQAVTTPAELVRVTQWADENGFNSYVQVNPTSKRAGVRCSGQDITYWCWFLFDIDPIQAPADPDARREAALSALFEAEHRMRAYFGMPEARRIIIDSGRGVQGWYPIQPLELSGTATFRTAPLPRMWDDDDLKENIVHVPLREAVPRAQAYWLDFFRRRLGTDDMHRGCTIDTSVSDLPRVMRIPFTKNAKTGLQGNLILHNEGINFALDDKLLSYCPYELWRPKDPIVAMANMDENTPWDQYLQFVTRGARIYLTEGASEGGRHRAAASALLSLKEMGCGKEQARAALIWGGKLCTPVLPPREINPMIERHYRRGYGPS